jgi:hypothetical protein
MLEVVASDPSPSAFLLSRLSGAGEGAFVAPVGGMLIFRTDTQVVRLYNGATWVDIGSGSPGPQGPPGIPGLDGADGDDGLMGPMGPVGATGAPGATGATGAIGPMGFPGLDGEMGDEGFAIPGPVGPTGATGATGTTGAQGPIGPAIPLLEDVSVEDVMRLGSPTLTVADIPALPTSKITTGTFDHHSQLTNFTANDDHTQYAFLNGRSGGQTLTGDAGAGGNLYLQSTAHATKGNVQLASSTLVFVETSGLASIYANMSTAGVGLATVLGVADPGIQSSGVTNSSIVIPPANGLYKVAVYVEVTTGAGTATVAVSIKYNDDSATAQTLSGFSGLSLTTTGNHNMSVFFVRALTTAAIQYSVTVTGTQGLARYRPFAVVERVA